MKPSPPSDLIHNSTSTLSELARTALLGIERAPVPQPTADSPLAAFATQLAHLSPEAQLLSLAGVSALYQEAGQLTRKMVPPSEPLDVVPDDSADLGSDASPSQRATYEQATYEPATYDPATYRVCSYLAGQFLVRMLEGTYRAIIPEFVTLLAETKQQIPSEYLPNMLDYGISQYGLRSLLLSVVGPQAQLLARENPKWAYASHALADWDHAIHVWRTTSNGTNRQGLLRHLRTANPTLALRLLESTWKSEKPNDRMSLIRVMETGLSMADESFLETALDDRNHIVRKRAAELLSALPTSRLTGRMKAATEPLLQWTAGEPNQLAVNLPDEISPEMQRDGIVSRTGRDEGKLRRAQLLDIVTATSLDSWTARWDTTPTEILQALDSSRWPSTLLQGFIQATERQVNLAWADAMLAFAEFKIPVTKLVPLLSEARFDQLLERIDPGVNEAHLLNKDHPLVVAVRRWPHMWSEATSRRWLDGLVRQIPLDQDKTTIDATVRTATKQFARCCAPKLIGEAISRLMHHAESGPAIWTTTLNESVTMLRFRQEMIKAIDDF